jgi:hypothetical protein
MKIGTLAAQRQRAEFLVRESQLLLDEAENPEVPLLRIETRRRPVTQDGKVLDQMLAGRNTRGEFVGHRRFTHNGNT